MDIVDLLMIGQVAIGICAVLAGLKCGEIANSPAMTTRDNDRRASLYFIAAMVLSASGVAFIVTAPVISLFWMERIAT